CLRGWEEQLSTWEIGRYRLPVVSAVNTSSPSRAPRPRPRPEGFLDAMGTLLSRESGALLFQELRRKRGVGLRAPGGPVIGGDGLAVAGRLAEAHVPGDYGGVDLAGEV